MKRVIKYGIIVIVIITLLLSGFTTLFIMNNINSQYIYDVEMLSDILDFQFLTSLQLTLLIFLIATLGLYSLFKTK